MERNDQHLTMVLPSVDVSFDRAAFDRGIRSHGVKLVHYRAFRCPVGMTDINDTSKPHPDHSGCSGGFQFSKVGTVTALFVGNSKHKNPADVGFWDGSTVQVSFPTTYDESEQALIVAPFDRFYLEEESIMVPMWQLFMHHDAGQDRLKYPPVEVQDLIDSRGERYNQGADFTVSNGQLQWNGDRRPAPEIDISPDRGAVCSIRYLYRPFWYCGQVIHEVRVAQIQTGNERKVQRMPQQVMLHREYVPLNKTQEGSDTGSLQSSAADSDAIRQALGPMNGGFGSR